MSKIQIYNKLKYIRRSFQEIDNNAKHWPGTLSAKIDMLWCMIRYGASPRNYYWFGFYELSAKQRKTFVTHVISQKMQRINNAHSSTYIFSNKLAFYQHFSKYMHRKCISSIDCSAEDLQTMHGKIIYKPLKGSQGNGISIYDVNDYSPANLCTILKSLPQGIVEEWIVQHDALNRFNSDAVNIVRVVTARRGERFSCLASTLAVANGKLYTNATSNAIFANIDLDTGVIISNGCDYDENIYERHPHTGEMFSGFQIPFWQEIKDMVSEASKVVPDIGYVGWDIAITPEGPVIVEGNNDPGYEWMQVRMINPSGIGKLKAYKEYLK